ncbi:hypothetical protein WGT02_11310 [Rhizobium sp. T1470]|uniref:hypothetical protein n=1 Tax=unclassified Rhizobium TaxID=2613769 RepID=UPI001CD33C8C|nr:hypothetical protein [Rhizobium sp. T1473]MCA0801828.1 hypothetical protein [Rhizobium sp. T1473]
MERWTAFPFAAEEYGGEIRDCISMLISAVAFNFDVPRADKDGDFAIHTPKLLEFS